MTGVHFRPPQLSTKTVMSPSPSVSIEDLLNAIERCLGEGPPPAGRSSDSPGNAAETARMELTRLADVAAEGSARDVARLSALLADLMLLSDSLSNGSFSSDPPAPITEIRAFCQNAIPVIRAALHDEPESTDRLSRLADSAAQRWGDYLDLLAPEERCQPFADDCWPLSEEGGWNHSTNDSSREDEFSPDDAETGGVDIHTILSALGQIDGQERGLENDATTESPGFNPDVGGATSLPSGASSASPPLPPVPLPPSGPLPSALSLELLPSFMDDAEHCLAGMEESLLTLETVPADVESLRRFCRELHTLKGASGAIGLDKLASYLHHLEDRVEAMATAATGSVPGSTPSGCRERRSVSTENSPPEEMAERRGAEPIPRGTDTAVDIELLLAGVDTVRSHPASLGNGESEQETVHGMEPRSHTGEPEWRREGQRTDRPVPPVPDSSAVSSRPPLGTASGLSPSQGRSSPTASRSASDRDGENLVRIEASRLDRLMDLLTELVMLRNRRDTYLSQLKSLHHELNVCVRQVRACGSQLMADGESGGRPEHQWASLPERGRVPSQPLYRALMERADDVAACNRALHDICEPLETDNQAVSHLIGQFRQELTDLRRLPVTGLLRRLQRSARDAARIEGKQVELEFRGQGTRAERQLQDWLFEPLMHVVRNAVSHGIESPDARRAAEKPPTGRILIEAHSTAVVLSVEISDDGQGLNTDALEQRGRELGLLSPGEHVPPEQLWKLIFHPGFSTRREITELAGRGVGMDVVASRIRQMRGRIDVQSTAGQGTTFRMQIPVRSPIEHAMVVRINGQLFAFPMQSIYGTGHPETPPNRRDGAEAPDEPRERPVDLGQLLGFRKSPAPHPQILTVRHQSAATGDGRASAVSVVQIPIAVDSVVGVEEVVLRSLPPMLQGHELFAGVTLSGDAETVLLFDVPRLIERGLRFLNPENLEPVSCESSAPASASSTLNSRPQT